MAKTELLLLEPPEGYRSREAALYVAQLDDMYAHLRSELAGTTRDELEWQPAPGNNSIGMLLAHLAIVEIFWIQLALKGESGVHTTRVLGIGFHDDGIPCPPDGGHPPPLAGKTLRWYFNRIDAARSCLKGLVRPLTAAGINRRFESRRRDGTPRVCNVRWVLYHLVEHFAGHQGQIRLLRHQYRDRARFTQS